MKTFAKANLREHFSRHTNKKITNYCRHDDEYMYADNDNDDNNDDGSREDGWDRSQLKRQSADD